MFVIKIVAEKCKGCLLCVAVCPRKCLKPGTRLNQGGWEPAVFDKDTTCSGCCQCALVCPESCIEIYEE